MHDSFTPIGGLFPMWLIQLGEVIFGGVGSGLYGMLMFVIVAVFVAGLMVGRTPEYLGKKIEAFEMKMASLIILIPPCIVKIGAAVAVLGPGLHYADPTTNEIKNNLNNPGAHGFSAAQLLRSRSVERGGNWAVSESARGRVTYRWTRVPIRDADGKVAGIQVIAWDVTDAKAAERSRR